MSAVFNLSSYFPNPYALPMVVAGSVIFLLGCFALIKNHRSINSLSFFVQSLSLSIWLLGVSVVYCGREADVAAFWNKFFWSGVVFIGSSFYFLTSSLLGEARKKRNKIIANYTASFVFLCFILFSDLMISGANRYFWGFYAKASYLVFPFLALFGLQMGKSLLHCYKSYRKEKSEIKRKQIRMVFYAFLIGMVASVDYFPALGVEIYPFGYLPVLILSLLIFYAIVHYQLWDISTVIHKTLMWLVSSTIILVPVVFLWIRFKNGLLGLADWKAALLFLITFTGVVVYLRSVQPFIDHLFQRKKYSAQSVLQAFINKLAILKGPDDLIREITSLARAVMYVDQISIYLRNQTDHGLTRSAISTLGGPTEISDSHPFLQFLKKENRVVNHELLEVETEGGATGSALQYFHETGAELCIPFSHDNNLIAVINLGKKRNLKRFSSLDQELLNRLKTEATIALSNALLYEDVTQLSRNLEKKVEERTTELKEANLKLLSLDQAKSAFFANVSHELKTPMTLVVTPLDNVLQKVPRTAPEVILPRETFESVRHNAYRLSGLISDLLDLTKGEIGKARIRPVEVKETERYFHNIFNSVVPLMQEKGLEFEFVVGPPLGYDVMRQTAGRGGGK